MENMADSSAIHIAFLAYRERSRITRATSIEDDEDFFSSFASVSMRISLATLSKN